VRDAKQKFNSKIITAKALTKKSLCRFLFAKERSGCIWSNT